jgi:hypothetical protein
MRTISLVVALLAALIIAGQPEKARAQALVSITVAPPALPVYVQPPVPGPGYLWTPGYWAWDEADGDYYWVPGTWVLAPSPGLLWTPGYWGWKNGVYAWNAGYWGPHVGFYGGVNYGFGFGGVGFAGGSWVGGSFSYNRAVANIGSGGGGINVYNTPVAVSASVNVSFNGGAGGIQQQPNAQELAAAQEQHTAATPQQISHQDAAHSNPQSKFKNNGGNPAHAATPKPGDFSHAVAAKSAGANQGQIRRDQEQIRANHQQIRENDQQIKANHQQIRQDHQQINANHQQIKSDQAQIKSNQQQERQDRKIEAQDKASGNLQGAREERQQINADKAADRADHRQIQADHKQDSADKHQIKADHKQDVADRAQNREDHRQDRHDKAQIKHDKQEKSH